LTIILKLINILSSYKFYLNFSHCSLVIKKVIGIYNYPYLLLTLAVLFWSGNYIIAKLVPAEFPPIGLAFWRLLGASIFISFFALPQLSKDWVLIRKNWLLISFLSLSGVGFIDVLNYMGLQQSISLNAFLMSSIIPVLIMLFSFVIFREKISILQLVGVILSLTGVIIFIIRGDINTLLSLSVNRGDVLLFGSVSLYSLYSVVLRKRPTIHPYSFLFIIFSISTITIFPFYIWETVTIRPVIVNVSSITAISYIIIFPASLAYLFYNRGVELLGANRAGLFLHLMPVFGSIMAILFLNEAFRWYHSLGIVLIASGIFLATGIKSRRNKLSEYYAE